MIEGRSVWGQARRSPPAGSLPPSPVDVVVVGGGLAGLSTAHHLLARDPGLRVAVIESAQVGAGASGRNTGMVGPGVGQSLAALVRRLGRERARALYLGTLDAVRTTVSLIEREGIECELEPGGQLVIARSRADRRRLRLQAEWMERLGLPHQALGDDALQAHLRLGRAAGSDATGPAALRLPLAALVHPAKLVAALAARVVERGGLLVEGRRVGRILGGGAREPVHVELDPVEEDSRSPRLLARRVVVATAGYTHSLGLFRGRVLPVHLQALATAPLPREARQHLAWRGREGVVEARRIFDYFRLAADDRLVFGGGAPRYLWGGSTSGSPAGPLAALEQELRRRFSAVPGLAELPVTHAWTGVIGYVLDALPAIGALPGRPAVLHLLGWCGHGLALSVAAGSWVATMLHEGLSPAQVRGRRTDEGSATVADLAWFRSRPPLVPSEPARWLAVRAAVAAMACADRLP